ncbi:MAG: ACT domain-containing protein [Lactobacillus sp.]|nr:ACT domain-containing protein [Lactobacillus sp.]
MKAILTVVGQDKVGIVAEVSRFLAEEQINILDISQTILDGYFTMMMAVMVPENSDIKQIATKLAELGQALKVDINLKNEEIYRAMHQL